jgi:SAM-dependent methyltransferase
MGTDPSKTVEPFDRLAARYDAWFDSADGRPIFDLEVACLADLMHPISDRWLEVGVGTGRFAEALGVAEGVDPSEPMLAFARRRGINTREGRGEDLPYQDSCFDGVLLVVTLCFLDDPERALQECARVLREGGRLAVGFVPAETQWGRFYAGKGRSGHPFYSVARFFTPDQVIEMADSAGLRSGRASSCLFSPPGAPLDTSRRSGVVAGAGFVAMELTKRAPARGGMR